MKRPVVILVGMVFLAPLFSGCANMRDSVMGNIRARSEFVAGVAPSYTEITVTWPTDPPARRFFVKLPDGTLLTQEDMTYDRLKKAGLRDLPFQSPVKGDHETYFDLDHDARHDVSHHLYGFGLDFIFVGEKPAEIRADALGPEHRRDAASFGRDANHGVLAGSVPFFSLPMTQDEIRIVFGPPEKIEKTPFL